MMMPGAITSFSALAAVISLVTWIGNASAEARTEELVRLSRLTVSAFRCSLLTDIDKESARLFMIGLTAGRGFLEGWNKLDDDERKVASEEILLLWRWSKGPTADFILGSVFDQQRSDLRRLYDIHEEIWQGRLERAYRDENCERVR
jgi:hypothetical protein